MRLYSRDNVSFQSLLNFGVARLSYDAKQTSFAQPVVVAAFSQMDDAQTYADRRNQLQGSQVFFVVPLIN